LLTSFPLRLDFDHRSQSVAVSGVEPSQLETAPLIDALAAGPRHRTGSSTGSASCPAPEQLAASQAGVATLQQTMRACRRASIRCAMR